MKTIEVIITETGRNRPADTPETFNRIKEQFITITEAKEFMESRYGSMPRCRRKIYTGPNNCSVVVGFLHSYWNRDCSHSSKAWFQTDWVEIYEIERKPITI